MATVAQEIKKSAARKVNKGSPPNERENSARAKRTASPARQVKRQKEENTIELGRRSRNRHASTASSPVARSSAAVHVPTLPATSSGKRLNGGSMAAHDPHTVPEEVSRRFVNVGKRYYFPDGARAFTDHGRKLSTRSENTEVIRSLLLIAQSRGWSEVNLRGTESFRREAWFAANLVGLSVRGFTPTALEQAQLARKLASKGAKVIGADATSASEAQVSERKRNAHDRAPSDAREVIQGRLLAHGRALYRHREGEAMSYFIKLKTQSGARELWGIDLERAINHSLSKAQVDDEVSVWRTRREPVTVKRRERDRKGVIHEHNRTVHRNEWVVEKQSFLEERSRAAGVVRDSSVSAREAVRTHPELAGTYVTLRAAELASKRMKDAQDRARFVTSVRQALADSIARGEPLAPVRLKERAAARSTRGAERARESARALG